jgi:hypothetical protein
MAARVAPSPPISPATIDIRREVLDRTAASPTFQRCPKLRELLLHLGDRAISNHPEELREQQIGCSVFGRRPDYSPAEDNIVRVEMRQLRKRLEEHFSTAGKDEPVVIVIPKGNYVPLFEPRESVSTPLSVAPRWTTWQWLAIVQGGVILVLAAVCLWLLVTPRSGTPGVAAPDRGLLWPLLFSKDQPTNLICADSGLVVARTLRRRPISLEEYVAGDYLGKSTEMSEADLALLGSIPRWAFTDIADVRLVQRIYRLNGNFWDRVSVRTARTTQVQDFKTGNSILLGSVRSNPWNQLFEPMLNFQFDFDEQERMAFIRNKSPQPGELEKYWGSQPGNSGEAYSVIALVPNLRNNGNVLIVAGTSGESTEATGEFLTSPPAAQLTQKLLAGGRKRLPYFQALLRSGTLAGVAKNAEIVAWRILPGDVAGQ